MVGVEGVLCMYTEMLLVGIEWFYFIFFQGFRFCCNYYMLCDAMRIVKYQGI